MNIKDFTKQNYNRIKIKPEKLGYGSSRSVWKISKNKVVKLAKNASGIAQNKEEVKIYTKFGSKLLARVFFYSEDYSWIISEYLKRTNKPKHLAYVSIGLSNNPSLLNMLAEWGEIGKSKNKIKIIDYGGTHKVINKFYK